MMTDGVDHLCKINTTQNPTDMLLHLKNNTPTSIAPYLNTNLTDLEGEIWKEIREFGDGFFQVSNFGRVKSLDRIYLDRAEKQRIFKGKIYRPLIKKYFNPIVGDVKESLKVGLSYRGENRKFYVNRLVFKAFIKNLNFKIDHDIIIHKDGNPFNNCVDNLILRDWGFKTIHTLQMGRAKPMHVRAKEGRMGATHRPNIA